MPLFPWNGSGLAYDVAICGGGLAGATLARQLKLRLPEATVMTLDRASYPVPEAAFKVGESTVEIAGFYFAEVVQLKEHLEAGHLRKCGLRYFWNGSEPNFARRPEVGLSGYTPCNSYQVDRGRLENELFRENIEAGIDVEQEVRIEDILLKKGAARHEVIYLDSRGERRTVPCRWVIDAMGRRRFLQTKLGLRREVAEPFNAVWFRVKGRLDIEDFVPEFETAWHARVPGRQRYYSTTHLMGRGYWIWFIPLGSGNTSVGIVTSGNIHDFSTMDTLEKAMDWMTRHDPLAASRVKNCEFMDFAAIRHYNYSSLQVFSADRWALVGEAAAFSDPFYSPGSNMIGFENSIITELVAQDSRGMVDESRVRFFNEFVLGQNDWLEFNLHTAYSYFGEALVMSLAFLWDTAVGWGTATAQMFNSIYLDEAKTNAVRSVTGDFYALALRVKDLFRQWEHITQRRFTFDFIDYYQVPFIHEIYHRNLVTGKSCEQLVADHRVTMERLEEFAQAILVIAVEDAMPWARHLLGEPLWVNAWAIGLDPAAWRKDGLFQPEGPPRSLDPVLAQLRSLYRPAEQTQETAVGIELDI